MKKVLVGFLALGLLIGCDGRNGLPYAREMSDTALLRTIGLDSAQEGIELTVSAAGHSGGEGALVLSALGASVPAAALAVQSLGDRYVYYGYVDQLLLGEELAARGVGAVLDYLAREAELGLGVQVWLVRNGTAAQAIGSAGGGGVPERLSQMSTDGRLGAANISRTAAELMSVLARAGSTYLPAVELLDAREGDGSEGGSRALVSNGYGIVRQGRLVCWTDDETARGIELIEERAFGHVVDLSLEDGSAVSLTVDTVRTGIRPVFRAGELVGVEVDCALTTRVAQTGRKLTQADLGWLRLCLESLQEERIARALELGQYWDADYLGLEQKVQLADPGKKTSIKERWNEAFRTLEVQLNVRGTIERTFGMMDTVG